MHSNDFIDKINDFLYYLIAVILVFNCRSMFSSQAAGIGKLNNILYYLLVISLIFLIFSFKNLYVRTVQRLGIDSIIIFIYIFIYVIFSSYKPTKLLDIKLSVLLILFFWIINLDIKNNILHKYRNIMIIVAFFSLLFWIFGSLLHILKPNGVFFSNWGARPGQTLAIASYYKLYFEPQFITTSIGTLARNSAIFTEAPMASLNFSIALLIEQYIEHKSKYSKWIKLLLIIAIISTISTTGYIVLILCAIIELYRKQTRINGFNIIKVLLIPIVVIAIFLILEQLLQQKINYNNSSINVRWDDYHVGFQVWRENMFWGCGVQNMDYIQQNMGTWRLFNSGFSNSIAEIFANGGLYLGIGYLVCFGRGIVKSAQIKNWNKMIFSCFILFLFNTTIFTYTYILLFLLIFMCIGYTEYDY